MKENKEEMVYDFSDFKDLPLERIEDKSYLGLYLLTKIMYGKLIVDNDIAKKIKKILPNTPISFWTSIQKERNELFDKSGEVV
jgi:hypothetical protein